MNKNQLINLRKKVMKILIGLEEKKKQDFQLENKGGWIRSRKEKRVV